MKAHLSEILSSNPNRPRYWILEYTSTRIERIWAEGDHLFETLYELKGKLHGDLPPSAVRAVLREIPEPKDLYELRDWAEEFLRLSGFYFVEEDIATTVQNPADEIIGYWPADPKLAVRLAIKWLTDYYPYSINRTSRELMAEYLRSQLLRFRAEELAKKIMSRF